MHIYLKITKVAWQNRDVTRQARVSCPFPLPLQYAALVDGVREAGGEALVFSSMHISGEQLSQLSGIAAILRFPLPELEDMELAEEI